MGKNKEYYLDLSCLEWIEILEVKNRELKTQISELDDGEADVIMLAKEINADLVIMDETLGREYAKNFQLVVTGTLGILLKAKEMGLIDSVGVLLEELAEKEIWLHPKLIASVRKMAGEE